MVTFHDSATTVGTVQSSLAVTLPVWSVGDLVLIACTGKYDTTSQPTISAGWTTVLSKTTGGTGVTGVDSGMVFTTAFARVMQAGDTAPTITAGATVPNSWEAITTSWSPGTGVMNTSLVRTASASDVDMTTSKLEGTTGSFSTAPTAGSALLVVGAMPTDAHTGIGVTTITCTGLSGGTKVASLYVECPLNSDSSAVGVYWTGYTGTASAGVTAAFTLDGANTTGLLTAYAISEAFNLSDTEADNLGLTDTVVTSLASVRSITDSLGLSDAVTPVKTGGNVFSQGPVDSLGLSDGSAVRNHKEVGNESFGLTDSVSSVITAGAQLSQSKADALGISDSLSMAAVYVRSQADSEGLSDGPALKTHREVGIESLGLSDSVVPLITAGGLLSDSEADSLGLTDSLIVATGFVRVMADTLGVADTAIPGTPFSDSEANNLGLTDSLSMAMVLARNLADTLGVADTAISGFLFSNTQADTLGLTDSLTVEFVQTPTDTLGLTDIVSSASVIDRSLSDTEGLSDAATHDAVGAMAVEKFGLTDSVIAGLAWGVVPSDTEGLSDSWAVLRGLGQADTFGLTDSLVVLKGANQADSESLSDSVVTVGGQATVAPSDSVALSDLVGREAPRNDSENLTDVVGRAITMTLADSQSMFDAVEKGVPLADSEGLADSSGQALLQPFNPADAEGLSDAVSTVKSTVFVFSETVGLDDFLSRDLSDSDTENLSDSPIYSSAITYRSEFGLVGLSDLVTKDVVKPDQFDSVSLSDRVSVELVVDNELDLTDLVDPVLITPTGPRLAEDLGLGDELSFDGSSSFVDTETLDDGSLSYDHELIGSNDESLYDQVNVVLTTPLQDNPTDTVGLTDNAALSISVTLVDSEGLYESFSFTFAPSEQVSLSDVLTFAYTQNQADTVALTDSAANGPRLSDSQALSDSVSLEFSISDAMPLSDALTREALISDVMPLVDVFIPVASLSASGLVENLGLTDALTFAFGLVRSETEGLSDTATSAEVFTRSVADTLGVSGAFAVETTWSDQASLSDALAFTLTASEFDSVTLSDAVVVGGVQADAVGLTDTVRLVVTDVFADSVALSDRLAVDREVHQDDTVQVADVIAAGALFSDSAGLSDSADPVLERQFAPVPRDDLGLTDAVTTVMVLGVVPADSESLSDRLSFDREMHLAETEAISDVASAARVWPVSVDDTNGLSDTISLHVSMIVADDVDLTDVVFRTTHDTTVVELLRLSDKVSVVGGTPTYVAQVGTALIWDCSYSASIQENRASAKVVAGEYTATVHTEEPSGSMTDSGGLAELQDYVVVPRREVRECSE